MISFRRRHFPLIRMKLLFRKMVYTKRENRFHLARMKLFYQKIVSTRRKTIFITQNEVSFMEKSSVFWSYPAHFNWISKFDQIFVLIVPNFLTIFSS